MKTLLLFGLLRGAAPIDSLPVVLDSVLVYPTDTIPLRSNSKTARLWVVGGSSLLTLGSTYSYLQRTWWNGRGIPFHLDGGRDVTYASGLNKVAHLAGGVFVSEAYYNAFRWAGIPAGKAGWLALGQFGKTAQTPQANP